MDPLKQADSVSVPLEAVLCTEELERRDSRPADYQAESRALVTLAQALADSPRTILQALADNILEVFGADSAGVSLLAEDGRRFYWPAIAGRWQPQIGGGTPREFGPCGDVLDHDAPLLFHHFERRYTYFMAVTPSAQECLLVPFYVEGKAVGTIWAITHDPKSRKFDREDLRMLSSLGRFASSAYWAVETLRRLERQSEALRDADRRKDEFLATLAHELRNPLAPISNTLQILRADESIDEPVRSACEMMDRHVGQIVWLVNDLLDLSRISRGTIELRKDQIELASPIHHAIEAIRPQCETLNHEVSVAMPARPIYVNADPVRLTQAVGNLLNNACKFTNPGGRIWLTVEREGEYAIIRVRDTGVGISDEQLPRIFDLYTQVDTSLERRQTGLGIGLMLVKNLIERHGGRVRAQSAGLGRGSEFVVHLPILADTPKPSVTRRNNKRNLRMARRILVVDDNRDSADSLARMLELAGNETHTAYDGLEAVEAAVAVQPHLMLLDIGMPKLNGYEAARKIRELPWGNDILLVAVTGWGQDEDRKKSEEAGFDGHVVKPVNREALMSLLSELEAARVSGRSSDLRRA